MEKDILLLSKKGLLLQNIKSILSRFSSLSKLEKQEAIETILNTPLDYFNFLEFYKKDEFMIRIEGIKKVLHAINFAEVSGKTFFKQLFKIISKDVYLNVIVMSFILSIIFEAISRFSISTLSEIFFNCFDDFLDKNKIKVKELEDEEFKKKISCYTLELLKEYEILSYSYDKYVINNFDIFEYGAFKDILDVDENHFLFYKKDNWPLIVPPKSYNDTYYGGYYTLNKDIRIPNKYNTQRITLTQDGFKILNEYQNIKYLLNTNSWIYNLLLKYKEFLYNKIKSNKVIRGTLDKYKHFLVEVESLYETYYLLIQYFMLVDTGNIEIYYTYNIDFRGRIYNSIFYGLNPTTSKLSRLLINFGKYSLTDESKKNLKLFIFAKLKFETDFDFEQAINKVKIQLRNFYKDVDFESESMEYYILLIDWIKNVEVNNESEILIELDASQSGFQMLSMFANDLKGLNDTNMLSDEKQDLYSKIFNKLVENISKNNLKSFNKYYLTKDCLKIINRKYIKKMIMTIPYGSTQFGQKDMFLEVFNAEYGLQSLFKTNTIPQILESNILGNIVTKSLLEDFLNKIQSGLYFKNGKNDIKEAFGDILICQKELEADLKVNFIPALIVEITNILKIEYSNIFNFVDELKQDIRNDIDYYNAITTKFYIFSILYCEEFSYTYTVNNTKYKYYKLHRNKIDKRKTIQGSIANICHGLGDSFILYTLMEALLQHKIKFYTIHDAILCQSIDVALIQNEIKYVYQYIYEYIIQNKIFKFYKYDTFYKFNSKNIFKIK